ncbi:MAG: RagB/SusD family nutrient uptake outer membrane protein, partial [Pedobacter sp.]
APAEIVAQLGPQPDAIKFVNDVRARAYGKTAAFGEGVRYVEVTNGGTGYTQAPEVSIIGGGVMAEAVAVLTGSTVSRIMLTNIGSGFTSEPTVIFKSLDQGSGAVAKAVLTSRSTLVSNLSSLQTADADSFREAIRKERSLELGYEALRRFDLVRWGSYIITMKNVANDITLTAPSTYAYAARHGNNISDRDTLLAIPSRELLLNRKASPNNGW